MLYFSQSRTQSFALSLNAARSAIPHFCSRRGHLRRWSIVCGSEPHSQVTSSVIRYPHFMRFALQRPVPVLSRLRHLHSIQLESAPGGSSSLALMDIVIDGRRLASFSFHNVSLMLIASMGLTALRKLFLDFSRLFAGSWPKRACRSSVDCRWRSLLLAALRRISDGWNQILTLVFFVFVFFLEWRCLNRLRTDTGRCKANLMKWGYRMTEDVTCECGSDPQTMDHLLRCPLLDALSLNSLIHYLFLININLPWSGTATLGRVAAAGVSGNVVWIESL